MASKAIANSAIISAKKISLIKTVHYLCHISMDIKKSDDMIRLSKKMIACLIVSIVGLLSSGMLMAAEAQRHTWVHQGMTREFMLYLPDNLPDNAPLVLVLHGHGGSAMKGGERLCEVADKEGFAVCYPQGILDSTGKTCWNVGYPFQADLKVDDVDFLCKLAAHLQKKYNLSKENTFCTGMSNGGDMCYLLAYKRPEVFAAFASIAGLIYEWMYMKLIPRTHVPLMEVHGTKDTISEWNGDLTNAGGWGVYIGVPQAVNLWATEARCTHEVTEKFPILRNEVILHRYAGGKPAWEGGPDTEVWFYEVINGDHSWAEKDMNTCQEIWRFFKKYVK